MPLQVDPHLKPAAANHAPLSPLDLLDFRVGERPGDTALVWRGEAMDWAAFDGLVQRFAAALAARGIGRGDVVSVIAGNRPEMLAAHFAIPALGAVLNAINIRLDAGTVGYILDHSGASLVICDAARCPLGLEAASVPVLCLGPDAPEGAHALDLLAGESNPGARIDWRDSVTDEWQPIALNYTSGTTGNPKGVVLHHRGAHQNALGNAATLGFARDTVYLWTLPLFHCNGWCHGWAVTAAGGTHVCLDGVDPDEVFAAIEAHAVTHLFCAPVVLYMLLDHPARATRGPGSRRVMVGTGGAAPTTSLIEQLDGIGFDLTHLYGLTESYGPATVCALGPEHARASPDEKARYLASQGRRHATASALRVVDGQGDPVPADGRTMGEIVLRGNTLMAGYLKDAEATATALRGGWFHTGDLAVTLPDGRIEIRDRAKDIIVTGGENVSSLEIEDVLHRHRAVRLAAVVAAPDEKWGEIPCAFIELKEGESTDADSLDAFCRDHLAGFKRPRRYVFAEIPKSATGKVQKFELRRQAGAG